MITIEELMTRNLYTLRADDTIGDAKRMMSKHRIHHLPILDKKGNLLGLVTHHDILAASESSLHEEEEEEEEERQPVDGRRLKNIMVTEPTTINPEVSLLQAANHIRESGHGCLPVVTDHKLVGIVTDSDFVEVAISLLQQKEEVDFEEDDFDLIPEEDDLSDLDIDTSSARDWD